MTQIKHLIGMVLGWDKVASFLSGLLAFGMFSSVAWSTEVDVMCVGFYHKQEYVRAAQCFRSLALAMGASPKLAKRQRLQKGRYMRNAALAYQRAAKMQVAMRDKKLLQDKAYQLYEHILKHNLCDSKLRCQRAHKQKGLLYKAIGYVPLQIKTGGFKASVQIQGYQFRKKSLGDWVGRVRPGTYIITVRVPNRPLVRKTIAAQGPNGEPIRYIYKPPQKPPKSTKLPTYSWVGYIGGGAAILAGSVVLAVGLGSRQSAYSCWTTPQCSTITGEDQKQAALNTATQNIWVGASIAATGGVLMLSGGILHATQNRQNTNKKLANRWDGLTRMEPLPKVRTLLQAN